LDFQRSITKPNIDMEDELEEEKEGSEIVSEEEFDFGF
jgi:hypothetical protein